MMQANVSASARLAIVASRAAGRTTVTFAPTRATFMRITHTDTVSGAPPWSIRSVRVSDPARHQGGN
jgi:hypothetical protein